MIIFFSKKIEIEISRLCTQPEKVEWDREISEIVKLLEKYLCKKLSKSQGSGYCLCTLDKIMKKLVKI
jgi:hypothetical protein